MKSEKHRITSYADGLDSTAHQELSDAHIRQARAHRALSDLLGAAYTSDLPDHLLDSLAERVLARVHRDQPATFRQRFFSAWQTLFQHPAWTFGTVMGVALILSVSLWVANNHHAPQPVQMESFVIHQTDDGSGFVRYFKYYKVDNDGNKLLM